MKYRFIRVSSRTHDKLRTIADKLGERYGRNVTMLEAAGEAADLLEKATGADMGAKC